MRYIYIVEEEDIPFNEFKIVYLKKEYISEIQILNKNQITCDGIECKISDYIKQINEKIKKIKDINDNSIDLIDESRYDNCDICKNNFNEYFCGICHKNICKNCYQNYHEEHKVQSLKDNKVKSKNSILKIKRILGTHIIPILEEENINKEKNLDIIKNHKDNNDILLIYDIIASNYNNYFHYKNIENILIYCTEN